MNLNPFNNTDKRQQIVNADNSQNESRAVYVACTGHRGYRESTNWPALERVGRNIYMTAN